ncbi:MAG: hypothetical protein KAW45_05035, partial [Thermoplasmatales archaeon]|nr:hypothetical protein [Thermoplasmatales archaeon]
MSSSGAPKTVDGKVKIYEGKTSQQEKKRLNTFVSFIIPKARNYERTINRSDKGARSRRK